MTIIAQNKCYTRRNCRAMLQRHSFTLGGGLTLVNGIRELHEVQIKFSLPGGNGTHDLQIKSTVALLTKLRGRIEKARDDKCGESRRRESKVMCKLKP